MIAAAALVAASACAGEGPRAASPEPRASPAAGVAAPTILFLGTSLTAGLGVDPEQAYPAVIQQRIQEQDLPWRVVNAGVSGETSAGARRRLEWLLDHRDVGVLVIETGANDGLRAQDPAATRANIEAMIERAARESPAPRVVLVAMEAPPNYGADYQRRFRALYPELAAKHGAALVPFLLEGVAGVASLNQADGIHPTPEGHRKMAERVWTTLGPLLQAQR